MNNNLIYDLGMHEAHDTEYYLKQGYSVVAIDADAEMVEKAEKKFAKEIKEERLRLLHCAITDTEGGSVDFHICNDNTLWSSLNAEISGRENLDFETVSVPSKRLDAIFSEYGVPYYCKIDIEGYDNLAIQTLKNAAELPQYISCESECINDKGEIEKGGEFHTLNSLYELGYRKFKLVDQESLFILGKPSFYYTKKLSNNRWIRSFQEKILGQKVYDWRKNFLHREMYIKQKKHLFMHGTTGPFGKDLLGKWFCYEDAKEILTMHRNDFAKLGEKKYSFWCDWHAEL